MQSSQSLTQHQSTHQEQNTHMIVNIINKYVYQITLTILLLEYLQTIYHVRLKRLLNKPTSQKRISEIDLQWRTLLSIQNNNKFVYKRKLNRPINTFYCFLDGLVHQKHVQSILFFNGSEGPAFFLIKFLLNSLWASKSFENSYQRA